MLSPDRGIALFTDGSCNYKDGSGGWAWVAIDVYGNEVVGSGYEDEATTGRMEMQAWIEGLTYLYESLGPCEILLYCDSQYVVLGATDRTRARRKNKDLWLAIDELLAKHEYVEPNWVKGHHESHYNHLADELAGNARKAGLGVQTTNHT